MGASFSEPLPPLSDTGGYAAIALRSTDKVRLIHATPNVHERVLKIVRELCHDDEVVPEEKLGVVQFQLPGTPFLASAGRDSATVGKVFAIRVFEEMNALGYDLVVSSDLARTTDLATWFFRKTNGERSRQPVVCVSPSHTDKIVVLRGCGYVNDCVKSAIVTIWKYGIQKETTEECLSETVKIFKLRGNPWVGEGEESALCRQLVLGLVGGLGRCHWRLFASTNIKSGIDSLFFVYDECYALSTSQLAMVSFNRSDRLRLFNFDSQVISIVRTTILNFYQNKEPSQSDHFGCVELKLKGYPFECSGMDAVATRQFVCRLLEALRNAGWQILTSMNISRKATDKSVFVMCRCETAALKMACVSLSDVDCVRFLNFSQSASQTARRAVASGYLPGVTRELARDGSCYEMSLKGDPWTHSSGYALHARAMLLGLFRDLHALGWQLVASSDVSAQYAHQKNGDYDSNEYPLDVHSLFFCLVGASEGLRSDAVPPLSYSELCVSDLEDLPTYQEARRLSNAR